MFGKTTLPDDAAVASPMKKQRATTFSATAEEAKSLLSEIQTPAAVVGSAPGSTEPTYFGSLPNQAHNDQAMEEEEL